MAIYILIKKINEDDDHVVYAFGRDEVSLGKIKLEKKSGKIVVIEEAPKDTGYISQRAGRKIFLHWRSGEYPEETCWAS